jgi:hypothetical protein
MLATRARIGEALAVWWCDVDLDAGTAKVRHYVVRVNGVGLVRTRGTKGGALEYAAAECLRRAATHMMRPPRPRRSPHLPQKTHKTAK